MKVVTSHLSVESQHSQVTECTLKKSKMDSNSSCNCSILSLHSEQSRKKHCSVGSEHSMFDKKSQAISELFFWKNVETLQHLRLKMFLIFSLNCDKFHKDSTPWFHEIQDKPHSSACNYLSVIKVFVFCVAVGKTRPFRVLHLFAMKDQ